MDNTVDFYFKKIMKKINIFYIVLTVLFFFSGLVFLIVSYVLNISEFNSLSILLMLDGFTKLRYYELILSLSVSSFIAGVFSLIILISSLLIKSKKKAVFVSASLVIVLLFCVFNSFAAYNAVNNYSEKGVYTDIMNEYQTPDDEYLKFYPFIDINEPAPYYSLNVYELDGSVLRTAQMFTDAVGDGFADVTVTTDYFESDKLYMMSKYKGEKIFYETTDEYFEELSPDSIKEYEYENYKCFMIILSTEKRFIIKDDNFYFSISVQDDSNSLNLDNNEFAQLCCEQFELFSDSDNFKKLPDLKDYNV